MARTSARPPVVHAVVAAVLALAGVVLAAGPAAADEPVSPDLAPYYVGNWYQQFLCRNPEVPEDQYWQQVVTRSTRPADVVWQIAHTEEYARSYVRALYLPALGRRAQDDPGSEYWVRAIATGALTQEQVSQAILTSPEYVYRYGLGQPGPRIYGWYEAILNRPGRFDHRPDAGEIAYWSDRIARYGDAAVIREIWYSPEATGLRVRRAYERLLNRQPSPGELSYWSAKDAENNVNVGVLIAATPEYVYLISPPPSGPSWYPEISYSLCSTLF